MTPREVAERWNCSPEHVQRLCARGELAAMKLGSRGWRIRPAAVEEYEARNTSAPKTAPSTPHPAPAPALLASIGPAPENPRFPELWGMEPRTKRAASSAAGRGRTAKTKKAALSGN